MSKRNKIDENETTEIGADLLRFFKVLVEV